MSNTLGFSWQNTYTSLPDVFYTYQAPTPVSTPDVVILNNKLISALGLDFSCLDSKELAAIFSGNQVLHKCQPFAQAYAGHQFGHFTMLGDGRAITLGEHLTPCGQIVDIQLKGAGPTCYSRRGDGRAAVGPMLREYIISEAMFALGIPSTRSLALVTSGEDVVREEYLPGAILTRVATSHIRVGTFEFAAMQQSSNLLEALVDYTIKRHKITLAEGDNKALVLLDDVITKQVDLITDWMRVGFIHGVMNTDNMALSGETLDYGPCAFMDVYSPDTVFSSIDHSGRYAYANQPMIANWNITKLAETLLPLIAADIDTAIALAKEHLSKFTELYEQKWLNMMRAKLGIFGSEATDSQLILDLLNWMQKNYLDYTNTFCDLINQDRLSYGPYQSEEFLAWYKRWHERLGQNNESLDCSYKLMQKTNPLLIPRNHRVEQALDKANEGNYEAVYDLLTALKSPYEESKSLDYYRALPKNSERIYQTFCGT